MCLQCRRPRFNPWVRRSPGEGNGNPLQCACPENPMDGEAWQATVHGVAKSWSDVTEQLTLFFPYKERDRAWILCVCVCEKFEMNWQQLFFLMRKVFFFFLFNFWLHYIFIALRGLSLVAAPGLSCSMACGIFPVVVAQSLSRIQLFLTPWTAAHQASLSFTISRRLLRLMSIELVMPSIQTWMRSGEIQSSHPLSSPFPPVLSLSQQQGLFQ